MIAKTVDRIKKNPASILKEYEEFIQKNIIGNPELSNREKYNLFCEIDISARKRWLPLFVKLIDKEMK